MFGVSHGQANALLIPYVARFNALARPDKFASAAALLGYIEEELPQRDAALLCADALDELSDDLGLPRTLKQLKVGITEAHFDEMADKALAVARPMENNPRVMTKEDCITLYREAME
jgi:alcohol dehydrogenase